MNSNLAETIQMLIGFSGMVVVTISILRYRLRKREIDRGGGSEMEEALEALRTEMRDMHELHAEQLADLGERMDFAERLLTRGRQDQPPS